MEGGRIWKEAEIDVLFQVSNGLEMFQVMLLSNSQTIDQVCDIVELRAQKRGRRKRFSAGQKKVFKLSPEEKSVT